MKKRHIKLHRYAAKYLAAASLFVATLLPVSISAKTYDEALSNYQQADFKSCVKNSRLAMKAKVSSLEKSKILKVMGICQFMIKNKSSAAIAFKNALKFNPNTEISPDEVLDTEVIDFFKGEKEAFLASKQDKSSSSPKAGTYAKTAKKTTLQVASNVSGKVSIEGIYAGSTGQAIDADGGQIEVTVSADGYRTRKVRVNVIANRENKVTINLSKPKPKPKPRRRPAPAPAVASDDREKRASKRNLPKADDGLFADEDSQPNLPERDLAREFDMESGTGGYPTYPQQAPAPAPVYPQPVYPAPVYTPPPVYAPPVAAPPVVEAPPPNYDAPADDYNPPPRRKPSRSRRRAQKSENNILITLAPFGAGQFQNGDTTMGVIIGGAQVGALIFGYLKYSEANDLRTQADADLKKIRDGEVANIGDVQCSGQEGLYNCQIAYIKQAQPAIDTASVQSQYGFWAFGGIWAAGVIEAMVNEPKSSRSSDRRRRRAFHDEFEQDQHLAWTQYRKTDPYWDVDLNFDPYTLKPIYGLGVRLEY